MPLKVDVTDRGASVFIVSPEGSIDANTYPVLEKEMEAVIARAPAVVIVTMEKVDYISSAGVSVLIKAKRALAEKKGEMVLVRLQPRVKKVFEIISALPPEQIFASEEELDRYLAEMQRKI